MNFRGWPHFRADAEMLFVIFGKGGLAGKLHTEEGKKMEKRERRSGSWAG